MQVNIERLDDMKLRQAVKREIDADSGEVTVYTETTVTLMVRDISEEDYQNLKDLMGCMTKSAAIGSRQGVMELFPKQDEEQEKPSVTLTHLSRGREVSSVTLTPESAKRLAENAKEAMKA